MDLTYTSRGVDVDDDLRRTVTHKLSKLERLEPRTTRIDLEFISEHHPTHDGTKRVEAALRIPRKTFRAAGEAPDLPTALDRVAEKLDRQIRDHHGKKRRSLQRGGLGYAAAPKDSTPKERA